MKEPLSLRIEKHLLDALKVYCKKQGSSITAVIEAYISTLDLDMVVESITSESQNIYITDADLSNTLKPFAERLKALEKVMLNPNEYMAVQNLDKYYADQLDTLQPYIKALVGADQDRLMDNLERQLDPTKDGMIAVIPEALGGRS